MIKIVLTTGYVVRCERYEEIPHEVPAIRIFKRNGKEEIIPKFMIGVIEHGKKVS